MQTRIMHLSDLHLGNDLVWRSVRHLRSWRSFVSENVTNGLIESIKALKPDYIIISGDIVNKPTEKTFRDAAEYLRKVFQKAGFAIDGRLFVVPGNHDVSVYKKASPENAKRLKLYRAFLAQLYGETDPEARRERFFVVDPAHQFILVGLDSTLKSGQPLAEGQIDPAQRKWLKDELAQKANELADRYRAFVKVAVFHHHLVDIAGVAPSGNRFMQLLDNADVLKSLHDQEFQIVLHGHRHFPHEKADYRADSGVLRVIGAGTTLCVFPEEQEGSGNNFNWIMLMPEQQLLTLQLFKANPAGDFVPLAEPKYFPLFRVSQTGYHARSIRQVSVLRGDGTLEESIVTEELRVVTPGKKIAVLPLNLEATAVTAKIESFVVQTKDADPAWKTQQPRLMSGEWTLKNDLGFGDPPISIGYSYVLRGGTAMSQQQYAQMYQDQSNEEATTVHVTNRAEQLHMEVLFPMQPKQFPARPRVRVTSYGVEVTLPPEKISFEGDKNNKWSLTVFDPPLDHHVSIVWELPQVWP